SPSAAAAVGCPPPAGAPVLLLHSLPVRNQHPGGSHPRLRRGRGNRLLYPDLPSDAELLGSVDGAADADRAGHGGGLRVISPSRAARLEKQRAPGGRPGARTAGDFRYFLMISIAALSFSEATLLCPALHAASASRTSDAAREISPRGALGSEDRGAFTSWVLGALPSSSRRAVVL